MMRACAGRANYKKCRVQLVLERVGRSNIHFLIEGPSQFFARAVRATIDYGGFLTIERQKSVDARPLFFGNSFLEI
jgi:hypothetical protein